MTDHHFKEKTIPELLAPAGNMGCLKAALSAGADAVYLGGKRFGARAYAGNFEKEELLQALDTAHLLGRKIYLTLNTLLKDNELSEVPAYVAPFYEQGLDGIITQDLGVADLLRQSFPALPIHASTQMSITAPEGALFLKERGFTRIVPARELSLSELIRMKEESGLALECFIHGALCYSYSGKCLFSSLLGGRSGNRGRCAGPCRLPYQGKYYLSAKDICCFDILKELMEAGIDSFKIEGRMKTEEYVAGVTGLYRRQIDRILQGGGEDRESARDRERLLSLYTRSGHSRGYYFTRNGSDMISLTSPSYESGDEAQKAALLQEFTEIPPKCLITGEITLREGEPSRLTLRLFDPSVFPEADTEISVTGAIPQKAVNQALTQETVKKQILKCGNTSFAFSELTVSLSQELFMTAGALNQLRRDGLRELEASLLRSFRRELPGNDAASAPLQAARRPDHFPSSDLSVPSSDHGEDTPGFHIVLPDLRAFEIVLQKKAVSLITVPCTAFSSMQELAQTAEAVHLAGKKLLLSLPVVVRSSEAYRNGLNELMSERASGGDVLCGEEMFRSGEALTFADGVLIDNPEELYYIKDIKYDKLVIADLHLYAMNQRAVSVLTGALPQGVVTTAPVELNQKELLGRSVTGEDMMIYGYLPMMVSAQCVHGTMQGCDHKPGLLYLKDRYGNDLPCMNHCRTCTNIIYNSVPLCLTVRDTVRLKPRFLRLSFTIEEPAEIDDIIEYYVNNKPMPDRLQKHTKGHFNRGVE